MSCRASPTSAKRVEQGQVGSSPYRRRPKPWRTVRAISTAPSRWCRPNAGSGNTAFWERSQIPRLRQGWRHRQRPPACCLYFRPRPVRPVRRRRRRSVRQSRHAAAAAFRILPRTRSELKRELKATILDFTISLLAMTTSSSSAPPGEHLPGDAGYHGRNCSCSNSRPPPKLNRTLGRVRLAGFLAKHQQVRPIPRTWSYAALSGS